jgi:serine/threonine protein kinase
VVAREKCSDYVVAIKSMSRVELEENNYCEQVKREIMIQSSLDHPNILKLYGYFWDSNAVSLILEYAPRGQLYNLMQKQGPLS